MVKAKKAPGSVEERYTDIVRKMPNHLKYNNHTIKRLVEYYSGGKNKTDNMITGCPRSGTTYMSHILDGGCNIQMPHEYIGKDGVVSWQHIGGKEHRVECDNILHQTREPLANIASLAFVFREWGYPFILYNIPFGEHSASDIVNSEELKIHFAMHIYEEWNNLIEKRAVWRYRIEDMPEIVPEVMDKLGFDPIQIIHPKELRLNNKPHKALSWDDLDNINKVLSSKIESKAIKYGYI